MSTTAAAQQTSPGTPPAETVPSPSPPPAPVEPSGLPPSAPPTGTQPAEPPAPTLPDPTLPRAATPSADESPADRFRRGKNLFEYGDCGGAVEALSSLAVPGRLKDEREQLDVHRMLGVCYVLGDRQNEGAREFSSLLSINPDFVLDPFLTPPSVVDVYERQKAAMAAQLSELRRARERARQSGLDGEGGVLVERKTVIRESPWASAFLPFGLAQAANGENVKAIVVGSTQGVFLTTNIVLFWTSIAMLFDGRNLSEAIGPPEKKAAYQGVVFAHLLAAVGFAGAYGYGVADALWNREDSSVIDKQSTRRALRPGEIKELKKLSPAASPPAAERKPASEDTPPESSPP